MYLSYCLLKFSICLFCSKYVVSKELFWNFLKSHRIKDKLTKLRYIALLCLHANHIRFWKSVKITEYKFLVPPRWILEPTDKAFAQGSDAAVECKADGFPKPVVTWKRATGTSRK